MLELSKINNNFEETFLSYIILEENAINIGNYIDKIEGVKREFDIIVSCHLNSEGKNILREFTENNIGNDIAITFDNKILARATVYIVLENTIDFFIDH